MFGGLVWAKRVDDEHWWDADPVVRKRNRDFEDRLEAVLSDDFTEPPQRRKDDSDVHPLIRYGVRVGIPSVMAACLVYWLVMKIDAKLDASLEMARTHSIMTASIAEQGNRTERLLERAVALMFAECFNGASTDAERRECRDANR